MPLSYVKEKISEVGFEWRMCLVGHLGYEQPRRNLFTFHSSHESLDFTNQADVNIISD